MKSLDPDSSLPSNQQIANVIRQAVESGEIPPGAAIPSRHDLMEHFGVCNATIAAAINTLKLRGVLVGRQGSGTFARTRPRVAATDGTAAALARIEAQLASIVALLGEYGPPSDRQPLP